MNESDKQKPDPNYINLDPQHWSNQEKNKTLTIYFEKGVFPLPIYFSLHIR